MSHPDRYDEFASLLQEASPRILAYLDAMLLNFNDAEDVFQESCIVLWQKFGRVSAADELRGLGDANRAEQGDALSANRGPGRPDCGGPICKTALLTAIADGEAARPDDALAALSGCMGQLPDGDRRLVQLCYGDGLPVRQMAAELGRSPQSIHNSLRRIRTTLLECVERAMKQEGRR